MKNSPTLDPRPEIIEIARHVALQGWRARAEERGRPEPEDLSGSCKFTSLMALSLFGGRLRGNSEHQYLELPSGERLDLNAEAEDVRAKQARGVDPWRHDTAFWNNLDHRASLRSCKPRVALWVDAVRREIHPLTATPPALISS